jgi:phage terminase large subunit
LIDQQAIEAIRRWYEHPVSMVRELFHVEPDAWQIDVLEAFPHNPRQAMSCAKGPGKTALLAWLGWNFLLTRVNCRCAALSITADTLRDTLWAELGKWQNKSPLLTQYFKLEGERITSVEQPKTWWMSARSFPRSANPSDQATALQGLHEEHVLLLIDEAGGVPRSVLATAEAILAGGGDQHIVMAGNPNNQDSALGQAVLNQRHNWHVTEVTGDPDDPKRSSRIDATWARNQIDAWGRDNPWVLVNVFGKFPPTGLNTLLSPDLVREAQRRHYPDHAYNDFPLIAGVDVARFGDDESVIFLRRGKIAYPPLRMRNVDTVFGASHLSRVAAERRVDSIQVDATGGYGGAWLDGLRSLGHHDALPVQFGGRASEDRRFANKRAEIVWNLADAIKDGLALPKVDEMVHGLSTMQYTYTRDGRIQIEEKDQIKARIGRSPDLEDALACTYAWPVAIMPKTLSGVPASLSGLVNASLHVNSQNDDPFSRGLGVPYGDSFNNR